MGFNLFAENDQIFTKTVKCLHPCNAEMMSVAQQ